MYRDLILPQLTLAEVLDLKEFFEVDLQDGTQPFNFRDPMTGEEAVFTFETMPSFTPFGNTKWQATFTIRKFPSDVSFESEGASS